MSDWQTVAVADDDEDWLQTLAETEGKDRDVILSSQVKSNVPVSRLNQVDFRLKQVAGNTRHHTPKRHSGQISKLGVWTRRVSLTDGFEVGVRERSEIDGILGSRPNFKSGGTQFNSEEKAALKEIGDNSIWQPPEKPRAAGQGGLPNRIIRELGQDDNTDGLKSRGGSHIMGGQRTTRGDNAKEGKVRTIVWSFKSGHYRRVHGGQDQEED
ncbi:hypothetical protein C8F04DRAFT_1193130 [Mycena alexandri]|uniref:Uncharacterized protein n=1 Tax=Mycena alexandri TaxID=1745969 RepID=A0AAD6SAT2_9AGAR|nr:hypothetical protein C8F04DRAFT_1193130 [Mycena alexandri]